MTIRFADGTYIEIAATAFDDFVKHDLKWAEFVHGRATVKKLACNDSRKLVPLQRASDAAFIRAPLAAAEKSRILTTDITLMTLIFTDQKQSDVFLCFEIIGQRLQ